MTFEKLVWIAPVVGALVLFIFWAIYRQWVASLACLEAAIPFSSRAVRKLRIFAWWMVGKAYLGITSRLPVNRPEPAYLQYAAMPS
jgi:hypothetical protein